MPAPSLERTRATTPANEERRLENRQKAVADAWADPGGMEPAIPCRLLDISSVGAKLGVEADVLLPDSFTLHAGGTKAAARVVWRRKNQIGVEFEKRAKRFRESG